MMKLLVGKLLVGNPIKILVEGVRAMLHEYWVTNSHVPLNERDMMWWIISQGQYETHAKHLLEITQIKVFKKFKEYRSEVNISLGIFVHHKLWYVRPITICDTCDCCYHVEFGLCYDTFIDFGKTFWPNSPRPSTIRAFISQIICTREDYKLSYQKMFQF